MQQETTVTTVQKLSRMFNEIIPTTELTNVFNSKIPRFFTHYVHFIKNKHIFFCLCWFLIKDFRCQPFFFLIAREQIVREVSEARSFIGLVHDNQTYILREQSMTRTTFETLSILADLHRSKQARMWMSVSSKPEKVACLDACH